MAFDYLKGHYLEFLNEAEASGYAMKYRQTLKSVIRTVLEEAQNKNWNTYYDVYEHYRAKGLSKSRLNVYASAIGLLREFEEHHALPMPGKRMDIAHKDKYADLPPEFKSLIDYNEKTHRAIGNSPSYIHCIHKTSVFFLYAMQQRGRRQLSEITEEDVVAFFNGKYDGKCRGYGNDRIHS